MNVCVCLWRREGARACAHVCAWLYDEQKSTFCHFYIRRQGIQCLLFSRLVPVCMFLSMRFPLSDLDRDIHSPSNNTSSNQRLLSISSSFFFFSSLFKQKRRVLKAFFKVNLNYLNSSDVCFEVYNFSSGVAPTQKRYSNKWVFAITKQSQLSINSLWSRKMCELFLLFFLTYIRLELILFLLLRFPHISRFFRFALVISLSPLKLLLSFQSYLNCTTSNDVFDNYFSTCSICLKIFFFVVCFLYIFVFF